MVSECTLKERKKERKRRKKRKKEREKETKGKKEKEKEKQTETETQEHRNTETQIHTPKESLPQTLIKGIRKVLCMRALYEAYVLHVIAVLSPCKTNSI